MSASGTSDLNPNAPAATIASAFNLGAFLWIAVRRVLEKMVSPAAINTDAPRD